MTEYFVRLPEHHVGRDYQPRPAGEEFIVAMATPRHLFNIGDHVWMAQLMVGICDYVEKNLGRPVVFEFIHRQDQQDIDEILGECLVVRQDDHSSYKNKFGQLAEIGRLLYPEQIKTRCVFDRLGGDARRARFIDKESWPVVMGTGLRNAPMVAPLGGMIEAWQETMKYKHMGFETVDCANENYRAPDLIIHCNQKNQMELRHSAATVDLKYDDLPFFLRHLAPSGVEFGLLGSSVFTRDDLAARAEQMRKYNCDPNVNMVPVQPVTQLWANSVGRVLQEVAVRHGVDAPVFSLPKNIDSPPHHGSIKKLGKMTTEANINFYPLCVIQASTSMKSKNPPMHVLMQ
ncbi:MAG TPA: hypothetical protein PKW15_06275, partial [Alphaproteobacteria bacterium]|nr:hypothetical protein [Alphaproteobacteria bacterium]